MATKWCVVRDSEGKAIRAGFSELEPEPGGTVEEHEDVVQEVLEEMRSRVEVEREGKAIEIADLTIAAQTGTLDHVGLVRLLLLKGGI